VFDGRGGGGEGVYVQILGVGGVGWGEAVPGVLYFQIALWNNLEI